MELANGEIRTAGRHAAVAKKRRAEAGGENYGEANDSTFLGGVVPKSTVELENEIKVLNIKLETLVDFLESSNANFGPPKGRAAYDEWAERRIKEAGLSE